MAKNVVPAWEIGRSVTGDAALIATAYLMNFAFCFYCARLMRDFIVHPTDTKKEHLRVIWGQHEIETIIW